MICTLVGKVYIQHLKEVELVGHAELKENHTEYPPEEVWLALSF